MAGHKKNFDNNQSPPAQRLRLKNEEIAVLLEKNGGFVSKVATATGMTISALHMRIHRSEMLQQKMKEIRATIVDIAESSLIKAAQNGESWAVQFILRCQGKDRGWVETQKVEMEHSVAPPPPVVLGVFPIDDKESATVNS